MKETSVLKMAKALVYHVFWWFGVPHWIPSRFAQIEACRFTPLWRRCLHTDFPAAWFLKHSTPYCPHSHDDVERKNSICKETLRALVV